MYKPVDLILASASPRRRELLALTGLTFEVDAPEVDEHVPGLGAREAVALLSQRKAIAAAMRHPEQIVLAADTLVALDNKPLGKPADAEEARAMLRLLSGREHQVYTGVCVVSDEGDTFSEVDVTDVLFDTLTETAIDYYVSTGEPMDKAGAYALQGMAGLFIKRVCGTPSGVIGLPLPLVRDLLERCGLFCLQESLPF